jgi:hypothetical protein
VGFRRQYCEWNRWTRALREVNCLYSAAGSAWLWATGNVQPQHSIVSYARAVPRLTPTHNTTLHHMTWTWTWHNITCRATAHTDTHAHSARTRAPLHVCSLLTAARALCVVHGVCGVSHTRVWHRCRANVPTGRARASARDERVCGGAAAPALPGPARSSVADGSQVARAQTQGRAT